MPKDNHWCCICGKGYDFCESCNNMKTFTPWRTIVDSVDHYKIFIIVKQYNEKNITKEEAKNQINNIDMSDYKTFKPNIVKIIDEILFEEINIEIQEERKTIKNTRSKSKNSE